MKHLLPFLLFFITYFFIQSAHAQSFTIEGQEVICAGASATLTASGCTGMVQWSTGATTASITVNPTVSTLYAATCTESEGNQQTKSHPVGVLPRPPLTASTPNLCANENVTLRTNTTEYTHSDVSWKRDGQSIIAGGGAYIANQAGTYTVEDTVTHGSWVPYPSAPLGGRYRTFSFTDENNGWAITSGKTLLKTEDGGQNWFKPAYMLNLAPGDSLADVEFVDTATGWLCAGGKIFKTIDGGQTWNSQYADNSTFFLYDLFFLDSQKGWAVGTSATGGMVLRTVDGGNTWQGTSLSYFTVRKVQFVSAFVGWAINEGGTLYKTTDGGATWQLKLQNRNYGPLTSVYFQDANKGWVGGERFLAKTSDGGATWTYYIQYSFYEYIGVPYAIKIVDGVGWVLDQVGFFQTSNGGLDWTRSNVNAQGGSYYENITGTTFFPSGKILTTDRTGSSMKYLPKTQSCLSSVTILPAPSAPEVIPSKTAALCEGESIILTASGCSGVLSWSTGPTEAAISVTPVATTSYTAYCKGDNGCRSTAYQGVAVVPKVQLDTASAAPCYRPVLKATQVWANMDLRWKLDGQVFDYRGIGPYIPRSEGTYTAETDAAGAWQPQAPTRSVTYEEPKYPNDYLKDIQFVNDSTGFIVGTGNQFLRTTDGGKNWIASKIPTRGENNGFMLSTYSLHFIDAMQGWISGSFNDMEQYGEILRTTDGGVSWEKIRLGRGVGMNDVFFVKTPSSYPVGWGLGYNTIINSLDGGLTWTPQTSNTTAQLKTIFFLDDHTGWVGGANGTLLITTNGGSNWSPHIITNVPNFQSLQFLDASSGWAVAANTNNGLYHTSDGGTTWTQVPVDDRHETYLKKVQFLNDSTGFVQSDKFIHATTDGGATWKKSYHHLNTGGMSFTDATHGWVIGGSIMRYVPASDACTSAPVTVLPEAIAPLSTLTSGSWDTPDVWSCGQVPNVLDAVRINTGHAITLPADYSAKAKSIEIQGEIQPGLNAGMQLGQD